MDFETAAAGGGTQGALDGSIPQERSHPAIPISHKGRDLCIRLPSFFSQLGVRKFRIVLPNGRSRRSIEDQPIRPAQARATRLFATAQLKANRSCDLFTREAMPSRIPMASTGNSVLKAMKTLTAGLDVGE